MFHADELKPDITIIKTDSSFYLYQKEMSVFIIL